MSRMDSQERNDRLLPDALRSLTDAVAARPRLTLWMIVGVTTIAAGITLAFLGFKTDRSDLIDPRADFHRRWLKYTGTFGDASDIVVVVEGDDRATLTSAIDDVGRRMQQEPQFFKSVLYKIDAGRIPAAKGLQYQSPAQLREGVRNIRRMQPLLTADGRRLAVSQLYRRWAAELDDWRARPDEARLKEILAEAGGYSQGLAHLLEFPGEFRSPWQPLMPGMKRDRRARPGPTFFLNNAGDIGFLKAKPAGDTDGFDGATQSIDRLRTLAREVEAEHRGVRISLTGIPVLENDEMRRSRADMSKAAVISFLGVGLLLVFGFRGLRHPLIALTMLAVGMAWAFGFTTVVVGHLNILSISFAVILIGLGIDFAIHYLARYLELRREGVALLPALAKTSSGVGVGVVAAAVTTAFAFFSATFTQFLGVAELGIIAGGGIILCAAATFFVLPALIAVADRNVDAEKLPKPIGGEALTGLLSKYARPIVAGSILLVAAVGSQLLEFRDGRLRVRLRYDGNLLNLQANGLDSVETQRRVFERADQSLLYAVSIADSPERARALKAKFEALPSVGRVEELATALPRFSIDETRPFIGEIRHRLAHVTDRPPVPPVEQPADVGRAIEQLYLRVRNLRHPEAKQLTRTLDRFLNQLERFSLPQQRTFLADYQTRAAAALHAEAFAVSSAAGLDPVTLADLPAELRARFVGGNGEWLLQVYPKENIWQGEPLQAFVADVRTVDPEVTGTPLQNFEAARQIKTSYKNASIYALAVIFLVLLIDFLRRDFTLLALLSPLAVIVFTLMTFKTRRIEFDPLMLIVTYVGMCVAIAAIFDFRNLRDALFAMLPPVAGGVMMFGTMGLLGIDLNPANLIALPLVLGIGVDDGVHIVHDFRSQPGPYRTSSSTMNAIVLTSLTSMLGFGSLMIAAHRGLYTVGVVLVIGVASCLFVSLVTLPALLTMVSETRVASMEATELRSGNRQTTQRQAA